VSRGPTTSTRSMLHRGSSTTATPPATREIEVSIAGVVATIVPRIRGALSLSCVCCGHVQFKG